MPVTINGSNTPTAGGVVYGDGSAYASTTAGSAGSVLYSAGASAPAFTAVGTGGQVLQSNGAAAPSWVTSSGASAATPTALGTVYGSQTTSGGTPFLTAYGYNAGLNATGVNNTAVGVSALQANTSATSNTAVGYQTLDANITGASNSALGVSALGANTTGSENTAIGDSALAATTTSFYNTAVGFQALLVANRTADTFGSNTAIGYKAGSAETTGQQNVYVGANTATSSSTSSNCIFIGNNAGNFTNPTTNGRTSVFIGVNAGASSGSPISEVVLAAKNTVGKGNSTGFINPDGGGVYQGNNSAAWSVTSDQRLKKNIIDNNVGLDAITSIRVRNFEYRVAEEITELPAHTAIVKAGVQLGVIAQELQAVLPDCVKTESTGVMTVDSDNLTWYLVNAVKQLKEEFDAYKASHP